MWFKAKYTAQIYLDLRFCDRLHDACENESSRNSLGLDYVNNIYSVLDQLLV